MMHLFFLLNVIDLRKVSDSPPMFYLAMDSQGAAALAATAASVTLTPSTSVTLPASSAASDMSPVAEEGERAGARGKERRVLDGVVVAFSGYKNPFRSELREMCLRLGAKYRQDWTDDCTHLMYIPFLIISSSAESSISFIKISVLD